MRIIGLTGGIGAGKSTVAAMLAERGAVVIDADRVAHEAYAPGTAGFDRLIDRFGREIVGSDGKIDRARLGQRVFGDRRALEDLNAIIHPLVRMEVAKRIREVEREDPGAIVVIEAALMAETGWAGGSGVLWAVLADPRTVTHRLVEQRRMDPEQVRLRLKAQATNDERRKVATTVIRNDGSIEELEIEVDRAWRTYLADAGLE